MVKQTNEKKQYSRMLSSFFFIMNINYMKTVRDFIIDHDIVLLHFNIHTTSIYIALTKKHIEQVRVWMMLSCDYLDFKSTRTTFYDEYLF